MFLTWPDTVASVGATVEEMRERAAGVRARRSTYGLRAHVIVRDTEADAKAAAQRLVSKLDDDTGAAIRGKSLDAASVGVQRQAALREAATDDGFVEEALWTGVGRPAAAPARPSSATPTRSWRSCAPTRTPASRRSSSPATRTRPSASGSARWSSPASTTPADWA